jgi:hypothetical protein
MPLNPTPTRANGTATYPGVKNVAAVDPILQGYVFASGIHEPEHSNYLSIKYPQYYLTAILERLGRYEAISQDTWSWNEMDRTRRSAEVTAVALSGNTAEMTLDVEAASAGEGYFLVGDVIRTPSAVNGRVISIGQAGGFQTLVVARQDGQAWTAGDLAAGTAIGHAFNLFGEYSDAPKGRLYLPGESYNRLNILRRSTTISGSEFTNKTRIGKGDSWYFTKEEIDMKEFARDREIAILTGQMSADNAAVKSGDGLLNIVENYGTQTYFTGKVNETVFQEHIRKMIMETDSKEFVALCGADFMMDASVALKEYAMNGAVNYGAFGSVDKVGLDLVPYHFMGKTINFVHYSMFDDQAVFPYSGAPSAQLRNYSNAALMLDLGSDAEGKKLVSLKYKELNGRQRKFIKTHEAGMMSPDGASSGMVSNGKDGFTTHMLSEIGVEVRTPKRHGIIRANG